LGLFTHFGPETLSHNALFMSSYVLVNVLSRALTADVR